ncbi:MAG: hypothetical protein R3A80_03485 [Bdellovibrionota bacterium]
MQFVEIESLVKKSLDIEPVFSAAGLRLRPNYLIYTLSEKLNLTQRAFLLEKEIPWVEYSHCSSLLAVLAFLKSIHGGIYIPEFDESFAKDFDFQYVFLLDPHFVSAFEESVSKKRRGVLIRRPLLAGYNFEKEISLEALW